MASNNVDVSKERFKEGNVTYASEIKEYKSHRKITIESSDGHTVTADSRDNYVVDNGKNIIIQLKKRL